MEAEGGSVMGCMYLMDECAECGLPDEPLESTRPHAGGLHPFRSQRCREPVEDRCVFVFSWARYGDRPPPVCGEPALRHVPGRHSYRAPDRCPKHLGIEVRA